MEVNPDSLQMLISAFGNLSILDKVTKVNSHTTGVYFVCPSIRPSINMYLNWDVTK